MKIIRFTLFVLLLVGIGFLAGYALGPVRYRAELERSIASAESAQDMLWSSRQSQAEQAFHLLKNLDDGKPEVTRAFLNTLIDFSIVEGEAHAHKDPCVVVGMKPNAYTAFLARIARHRAQFPVTYDDGEHAEWMSNLLSTALLVESQEKQNKSIHGTREELARP